jgi:hypothetical protein
MRWLTLLTVIARVLANLTDLLRDRRARATGWEAAVAAGERQVDERAKNANAAAAASRADPELLRDDGHRRD